MLIAMAGLPGSGKSTLAGEIARALGCSLLSVDPIDAAMWRAGVARDQPTGLAAYVIAEDLAREQMLLGHDVVVDAVNDADGARGQWAALAAELAEPLAFVAEWTGARLRLDSMLSQQDNVAAVLAHIASRKMRDSSSGRAF